MAPTLTIKRGSTFRATCTYVPPVGGLANLIGATITSQIRANGAQVAALQATIAADGMSFVLTSPDPSDTWPAALAVWDICVAKGGQTVYTETVQLQILERVTRP